MIRCCVRVLACLVAVGAAVPGLADEGLAKDVTFTDYSQLSTSAELARRLLTPLSYRRVAPHLADARSQSIDLAQEKFIVYVPSGAPPQRGYGVLVFVPPWPQASLPADWPRILDRRGIIFVSAAHSGNEAATLDRRVPLALLAYENIRRHYPLDADRVYVGGLSGGSRVALRIALAYPDVFRGALLNAGSDPIGTNDVPLPPGDLLRGFQESTRLVFLTGERDEFNQHADLLSQKSLRAWCVFGLESVTLPRRAHEIADAGGLAQALKVLHAPSVTEPGKLARCRTEVDRELASDVAAAESALDRGDRDRAIAAMRAIDARYGGLAEQAITEFQARLDRRE